MNRYNMNQTSNTAASYPNGYRIFRAVALCQLLQGVTAVDKEYCSSDSCCINKRSYEPLRNHEQIRSRIITTDAGRFGHVGLCQLRTKRVVITYYYYYIHLLFVYLLLILLRPFMTQTRQTWSLRWSLTLYQSLFWIRLLFGSQNGNSGWVWGYRICSNFRGTIFLQSSWPLRKYILVNIFLNRTNDV